MEIKSVNAINALNRMKRLTKKETIKFSDIIPAPSKELLSKKQYMKSDEFFKDEQNAKMMEMSERLLGLRDKIAQNIKEKNKTAKDELVQGINGYARIKKYLDINTKMNFSESQTFHTPEENEFYILKNFKIGNFAREIRNQLGLT